MNEESFKLVKGFKSYINNPEITNIGPNFLVKYSKNVLIDNAARVISRNGYSLYRQANNGGGSIKSSYEWATSSAKTFPIRVYDGRVEFDWNSTFNLLQSGFASSVMDFAKVWDNTEKIDVLLFVMGDTNRYKWSGGVAKVRTSTGTTLTKQGVLSAVSTIAFVAGTPGSVAGYLTDSANNFLNAGFAAGDTLYVTGSAANSRNFTIGSVTAGQITLIITDSITSEAAGPAITIHNGEPTWATSRFLTTGTRQIVYGGVSYTYTGGEGTDTLTGLTAFPAVSVGDVVWQTLITIANPAAIAASFKADFISVQLNQVILGSSKSQEIYGSSTTDYTNYTLTSPRAPGDPFKVTMDNYCTCIVPVDNVDQTISNLIFGGGTSEFFKFDYKMSQDNSSELVRMLKLKTSVSSGVISRGAISPIKNSTAYISREPALELLGSIQSENSKTKPISDPIKNDFDTFDFTNAHVKYWKRSIYIALPAMGLVLIYDMQQNLWQPPQTIPVSRFAIINDLLYGHSSITNETYKLFDGTDDNGTVISQVARFSYNNGGRRDRIKEMSEYWTDGYITGNAELDYKIYFDFNGQSGIKPFTILGNDTSVTSSNSGSHLGDSPLGLYPLGGATLSAPSGLPGTNTTLLRFYQVDTLQSPDHIEHFVEYTMNTLGGQFAIVAHGSNEWDASAVPIQHKK